MAGWELKRRKVRGQWGKNWWFEARIDGKRYRESTGRDRRKAAEAWGRERYNELIAEADGEEVIREDQAVGVLITDYVAYHKGRGTNVKHRTEVRSALVRLVTEMAASKIEHITPERIRHALDSMTTLPGKGHKEHAPRPLSAQRKNGYRQALNQWFRWLVRERRARHNPVDSVQPYRVVPGDARPERRALSVEEVNRLFEVAHPYRALVYRVAACTGLRRKELRWLAWSRIDLKAGVAMLEGSRNKARRADSVPLAPGTVAALAAHKADPWACYYTERDGKRVWKQGLNKAVIAARIEGGIALPPPPNLKTFYRDLRAAGIENGDGWIVDLHALRVTFGTTLAKAGVGLRDAQKLMRHKDPKLTERVYTRVQVADYRGGADAVEAYLDAPAPAPKNVKKKRRRKA